MTEYADAMRDHLAAYKSQHHPGLADGIYRGNGRAYPHVLPEELYRYNIIPSIRDEFWAYFEANKQSLALHTDFHHLNSSQAFAFNVFYPWMREQRSRTALLQALQIRVEPIARWHFEHIPDPAERTTFDLFAEYEDGARLLVEVKLTEAHFGLVQPNASHQKKRETVYLPRLVGKVRPEFLEEAHFFLHYQLLRNVSHLQPDRGDQLLLLVPEANAFTWSQATGFLDCLLPQARDAVRVVPAEALMSQLTELATGRESALATSVAELSEKYLPDWRTQVPVSPA